MPLYDYKCKCGEIFEAVNSIADRHTATCICGRMAKKKMSSWGRVIFAAYDTVVNSNGIAVSRKQSTEEIPMLPEKVHGGRF